MWGKKVKTWWSTTWGWIRMSLLLRCFTFLLTVMNTCPWRQKPKASCDRNEYQAIQVHCTEVSWFTFSRQEVPRDPACFVTFWPPLYWICWLCNWKLRFPAWGWGCSFSPSRAISWNVLIPLLTHRKLERLGETECIPGGTGIHSGFIFPASTCTGNRQRNLWRR